MISIEKINKKINSTTLAVKITFAMKMLAKVKLQKIKKINKNYQDFFQDFFPIYFQDIRAAAAKIFTPQIKQQRILIAFGSDLGLCGPFNNIIAKYLYSLIKPEDKVIICGHKLTLLFESSQYSNQLISKYSNLEDQDHCLCFHDLSWRITKLIKEYKGTQINLLYMNQQISSVTPQLLNIFEVYPQDKINCVVAKNINWVNYFSYSLQSAYWFNKLVEYSNRLTSMTLSNENAEELLKEYRVQYNKIRQNHITEGILEIINSSKIQDF